MNSFRCTNCSLLNFDTAEACKRCGLPFESAAEPENAAHASAPSEPYPQPAESNPFWDQPYYQPSYVPPRPEPPSSSGKGIVVGIAVFLAVSSLIAFVAIPMLTKSRKATLPSASWSEYKAPDGSFTVSLPAAPKELQVNQPTPEGKVQVRVVTAQLSRDSGCMVMYAEYPSFGKVSEEMLYEQALKRMESPNSSRLSIGERKFITQDGHRGLEVEFKPPTTEKLEAKGRARLFLASPKLFMVMSAGPDTPEFASISDRCLDSFKFTGGQ